MKRIYPLEKAFIEFVWYLPFSRSLHGRVITLSWRSGGSSSDGQFDGFWSQEIVFVLAVRSKKCLWNGNLWENKSATNVCGSGALVSLIALSAWSSLLDVVIPVLMLKWFYCSVSFACKHCSQVVGQVRMFSFFFWQKFWELVMVKSTVMKFAVNTSGSAIW